MALDDIDGLDGIVDGLDDLLEDALDETWKDVHAENTKANTKANTKENTKENTETNGAQRANTADAIADATAEGSAEAKGGADGGVAGPRQAQSLLRPAEAEAEAEDQAEAGAEAEAKAKAQAQAGGTTSSASNGGSDSAAGGPKEWVVAAGPSGGTSVDDEVVAWFERNQHGLLDALAEPDLGALAASTRRFGWDDRGYKSQENWASVAISTAKLPSASGYAVVGRRLTKRDAEVLAARINGEVPPRRGGWLISGSTAVVWRESEVTREYTSAMTMGDIVYDTTSNTGSGSVGNAPGGLDRLAQMLAEHAGHLGLGHGQSSRSTTGAHNQATGGGSGSGGGNGGGGRNRSETTVHIRYRRRSGTDGTDGTGGAVGAVGDEGEYTMASVQTNDPEAGKGPWLERVRLRLAQQNGWPLVETVLEVDTEREQGGCLGETLDPEDPTVLVRWCEFHQVDQRVHKIPHNAMCQLIGNAPQWDVVVTSVCTGPNRLRAAWRKLQREGGLFTRLTQAGWCVVNALTSMRNGTRELGSLVQGLDPSETAVVEHVLCQVKALEADDSKYVFPKPGNIKALLSKPFIKQIVTAIVSGNWDELEAKGVLDEQQDRGWELKWPCAIMRSGSRDLFKLTQECDPASACVVEGILEKVLELEGPGGPWLCTVCGFRCDHEGRTSCEMCGATRPSAAPAAPAAPAALPTTTTAAAMHVDPPATPNSGFGAAAAAAAATASTTQWALGAGAAASSPSPSPSPSPPRSTSLSGLSTSRPFRPFNIRRTAPAISTSNSTATTAPVAQLEPTTGTPQPTLGTPQLARTTSETTRENERLKRELETKEGANVCVVW